MSSPNREDAVAIVGYSHRLPGGSTCRFAGGHTGLGDGGEVVAQCRQPLAAFIHMQFNHQVSALELMTTATCLSLAEAIMQGDQTGDEDNAEAEDAGAEHTIAEPPRALRLRQHRRRPLPQRHRGHT